MPFTTIDFWSFFAVVVTGYYAFPKRIRWWILLAGSLFFYGWLSPIYLVFMAATIAISYSAAMLLDLKNKEEEAWIERAGKSMGRDEKKIYRQGMNKKRTRILAVALLLLLSMLLPSRPRVSSSGPFTILPSTGTLLEQRIGQVRQPLLPTWRVLARVSPLMSSWYS